MTQQRYAHGLDQLNRAIVKALAHLTRPGFAQAATADKVTAHLQRTVIPGYARTPSVDTIRRRLLDLSTGRAGPPDHPTVERSHRATTAGYLWTLTTAGHELAAQLPPDDT